MHTILLCCLFISRESHLFKEAMLHPGNQISEKFDVISLIFFASFPGTEQLLLVPTAMVGILVVSNGLTEESYNFSNFF